jgi:phage regulator Rha-like protein
VNKQNGAGAMEKQQAISSVSVEHITQSILILRGHKVMLDAHLAAMYGVETKVLLQAVKRNLERFPADFMLQLSADEWSSLRSQFVTLKAGRGQHRKYLPYVFTEQGVAMLSTVLNSKRAIAVNIEIMRAFVRMRELLASNKELAQQLKKLERKVSTHDEAIVGILKAIRQLMNPSEPSKRSIGFIELQDKKKS